MRRSKKFQVHEQKTVDLPINLEKGNIAEMRRCDLDDSSAILSQSSTYRWASNYSAHLDHPDSR